MNVYTRVLTNFHLITLQIVLSVAKLKQSPFRCRFIVLLKTQPGAQNWNINNVSDVRYFKRNATLNYIVGSLPNKEWRGMEYLNCRCELRQTLNPQVS